MVKDPKKDGVKIDESKIIPNNQNVAQKTDKEMEPKKHVQAPNTVKTSIKGKKANVQVPAPTKGTGQTAVPDGLPASHSLRTCKLWDYINDMKKNNCFLFYQEFGVSRVKTF